MNYTQNEKILQIKSETAVVGIDIGSEGHYARIFDWRGMELGKVFDFSNTAEGFQAFKGWVKNISNRSKKTEVMVGIEPTGHYWFNFGTFVNENDMRLVMVNPFHVKRTKEMDDNNQTKNDRKDPKVIAKLMIEGRYSYPYIPKNVYAEIRNAVVERERIVAELSACENRVIRWFDIHFPEYRDVYGSFDAESSLLLLKQAALPEDILEMGAEKINQIWRDAKLRAVGMKRAKILCNAAFGSVGCKEGLKTARIEIRHLLNDFENKKAQKQEIEDLINELVILVPYSDKMLAVKGIGIVTVSGFIAEVGDISRFSSPKQIQKLAGLAMQENSSGKHKGETTISKRGRARLRKILFNVAMSLVAKNNEFKQIHQYYINRGYKPLKRKESIVAISCKVIRLFYVILIKGVDYDAEKMLKDIIRPLEQQAS